MAFVPRLGPAGAGLLAAFLAVRGGRLGGGARGLLRALQPQHQLDQVVLTQAFEIGASHDGRQSASSGPRKGGAPAERSASRQPRRPTPWVITRPSQVVLPCILLMRSMPPQYGQTGPFGHTRASTQAEVAFSCGASQRSPMRTSISPTVLL